MPRTYVPKKPPPSYTEDQLKSAVADVSNGNLSVRRAAQLYNIPQTSIYYRVTGKTQKSAPGQGRPLVIDRNTEQQIAQCLIGRAKLGYPCDKTELMDLVQAYIEANGLSTSFTENRPGEDWYRGFMLRNPCLSLKKPEHLQKCRMSARVPEVVYDFYDKLKEELDTYNLHDKPSFVYNCDESGFPSDPSKLRAIGEKGEPLSRISGGSGRETTTVLACGNALGEGLPPLIVFAGKAVQSRWTTANDYPGTMYATSNNGWMEETVFYNWLDKMFIPHVQKDRAQRNILDQQALLIFDGHASHSSLRIIELAIKNKITLLRLPSHLTDKIQPLDVAVFNPVKIIWEKKLVQHGKQQMGRGSGILTKELFSKFLGEIWKDAMKANNIKKGFEATGIMPCNPDKFDKKLFDAKELAIYQSRKNKTQQVATEKASTSSSSVDSPPGSVPPPELVNRVFVENPSSINLPEALDLSLRLKEPSPQKPMSIVDIFLKKVKENSCASQSATIPKKPSVRLQNQKYGEVVTSAEVMERVRVKEMAKLEKEKKQQENKKRKMKAPEENLKKMRMEKKMPKKTPWLDKEESGESEIDDDLEPEDSTKSDRKKEIEKKVGAYVIFRYEGSLWPGKIMSFDNEVVVISSMQKSLQAWKWPEQADILTYPWQEVVCGLNEPRVKNKRGFYAVPELEDIWDI